MSTLTGVSDYGGCCSYCSFILLFLYFRGRLAFFFCIALPFFPNIHSTSCDSPISLFLGSAVFCLMYEWR
jgi:hypothetical protein